jgi:uncharacterized protein YabE (DUF348 family)
MISLIWLAGIIVSGVLAKAIDEEDSQQISKSSMILIAGGLLAIVAMCLLALVIKLSKLMTVKLNFLRRQHKELKTMQKFKSEVKLILKDSA